MSFVSDIATAFVAGGMWMWVILALNLVAVAICVERGWFLYLHRKPNQKQFAMGLEGAIRRGDLQSVLEQSKANAATHPIARVIEAGTQAAMNFGGKDEIQGKMDEILIEENGKIESRTGFLSMLANAGTLTGLLGTIAGMIKSFSAVSTASPVEKATMLSTGISEAMNTTAYGLIMAIPTIIVFAILSNRANQLSEDMNQGALKVFNWLSYTYEPVSVRPARVAQKRSAEEFRGQEQRP